MDKKEVLAILIVSLLLVSRFYFYFTKSVSYNDGDRIKVSTTIRSEPVRYDSAQYLKIIGLKTYLPLYPEVRYGDKIVIEGVVEGDKLKDPELISLEQSKKLLYSFRNRLLAFYEKSLPSPHSALIAGVTIGSKASLPEDFWESLKNSGTAHVVVASGMNVTLVGGFLMGTLVVFLKRKKALIITLIGIWAYSILSGFDAPIVRSAIMGSIAFSAQEIGRLNISIRALMLSGIIMLFINPSYINDVGFLLSFFATLGIILFESKIRKWLSKIPDIIKTDLSTTLAAQLGVVPLLYYYFGQLNVLSPVINTFVLWTVVPITIIGMLGGVIGVFVPTLGHLILLFSYPLTSWFIFIVELFGGT